MQPIAYQFDTTNVDPYVGGFKVYEAGKYVMAISDMEVKPNNDSSTGHNLRIEYTITEGKDKGGKFFENLNLWHQTSSAAVEIANKQLSSIAHAVNVISGTDLTQLANIPMIVELDVQAGTEDRINENTGAAIKGRGPQNRVVRRDPYTQQTAAAAAPHKPAAQPVSNPNAGPATAAPAMNPAAQASPAAQAAPAFTPPNGAAAGQVNGAAAAGGAAPPWQR
jgi:hypothetical protein